MNGSGPGVPGDDTAGLPGVPAGGDRGLPGDVVQAAGGDRGLPGDVVQAADGDRGLPGDVRPRTAPLLDRAPGERFAAPDAPTPFAQVRMGRALAAGVGASLVVAAAWLALGGGLGLDWGLAVVALAGGWMVGRAVSAGAWGGERHVPAVSPRVLAAGLALIAWLSGQVAVYLWTRVTLPESTLTIGQRIAATPFTDYFGGIAGPLEVIEVLLITGAAWFASR